MAVDIRIDGYLYTSDGGYSIQEDATPVSAADTTGGVGQTTFTLPERSETKLFVDSEFELRDGTQGVTRGIVRSLSIPDGVATITAESRLVSLISDVSVAMYQGTLGGAITYYLSLVGITANIVIDPTLFNIPVVLPGFKGDMWFNLAKTLAPIYEFEISLVSNNIVFRPLRQRKAQTHRDASRKTGLDNSELAQSVVVHYYSNQYKVNSIVYPSGGWNEEVQIYQVGSGVTQDFDIDLDVSLLSIQQPVPVDYVDRYYAASSVYSITGKDGLPYTAAQWIAGGGGISVKINEDTTSITVTIVGATDENLGPFTIAMSAGASSNYSSLRLVGTGVFSEDKQVSILTGQTLAKAPQDVGFELKNKAISTIEQAYDAAQWISHAYSVPKMTLSVTTKGVNRLGDNGNYRYPIVDEWNAEYAGLNLTAWNAVWAGQDVFAHDKYWQDKTSNDFANQAFGNIVGTRVLNDYAMYRIRTSTVTAEGVSYDAEWDTTMEDLNNVWVGATVDDWNAKHGLRRLDKLVIRPLER